MSQHLFSEVPKIDIPRSMFSRPHNVKTTIDVDYLYPVYVDEALPGDTFRFTGKFFGRLTTPVVPIMDTLYLDTFFFAVPIRLLDDNFRKVMGERPFGDTTTQYVTPVLTAPAGGVPVGSLSDYLGIPVGVAGLEFVAYWHRAYNLIYNEWFRDENLCTPVKLAGVAYDGTVSTETLADYVLLKRGKRHDYFTSALPWPQKGDAVSIGLTGTIPVYGNGKSMLLQSNASGSLKSYLAFAGNSQSPINTNWVGAVRVTNPPNVGTAVSVATGASLPSGSSLLSAGLSTSGADSGVLADLGSASAVTINNLREAFALQSLLESDARAGTRLIEILRGHFGVVSPDARMQRPEYLGGFSQPLGVTSVPQTSSTDNTSPQGNLSAFVTVGQQAHWIKSFTEHCVILGLANIRADLSYQQGLPRMFSRRTRYDFYWPELANLGEQAILNKEIYAQAPTVVDSDGNPVNEDVFGYQERWAEYRYHPNMITGKMRSSAVGTLDYWHLAQNFTSLPTLSSAFIEESVPIDRVLAVQNEPAMILDCYYDVKCARPMPLYSIPGIGRRF